MKGNNKNLSNEKSRKSAFTFAEVLITLGIIGVVAALTIPPLVTNYQKHVVENRLFSFYSMINQALRSYVATNGELDGITSCYQCSYSQNLDWLKTHILSFIKYKSTRQCRIVPMNSNGACVYLNNGDSFVWSMDANGGDLIYCVNCDVDLNKTPDNPRKRFYFQFYKGGKSKNFIEPYTWGWNSTTDELKNNSTFGCNKNNSRFAYCAKYIQVNGWKIPDDYPW